MKKVIKPRAFPWRNINYLVEVCRADFITLRAPRLVMSASPSQCHFDPKPSLGLWFYQRYFPWYERVYFKICMVLIVPENLLSSYTNFFAYLSLMLLWSAALVLISISAIAAYSSFVPQLDLQAKAKFLLQSTSSLWFMSITIMYKCVQVCTSVYKHVQVCKRMYKYDNCIKNDGKEGGGDIGTVNLCRYSLTASSQEIKVGIINDDGSVAARWCIKHNNNDFWLTFEDFITGTLYNILSWMRFWYSLSSRPFSRPFASSFEIDILIFLLPLGIFIVLVDVVAMVAICWY